MSARTLQPADVGRVERVLGATAGVTVTLSVLNPDGLIARRDGYTTVQRAVEEAFNRQLAGQNMPARAGSGTDSGERDKRVGGAP